MSSPNYRLSCATAYIRVLCEEFLLRSNRFDTTFVGQNANEFPSPPIIALIRPTPPTTVTLQGVPKKTEPA